MANETIMDALAEYGGDSNGAGPSTRTLVGELAEAYEEFQASAKAMEQTAAAHQQAQERFRKALGRFTQLAATAPDV